VKRAGSVAALKTVNACSREPMREEQPIDVVDAPAADERHGGVAVRRELGQQSAKSRRGRDAPRVFRDLEQCAVEIEE
jgi:hypothetical protein